MDGDPRDEGIQNCSKLRDVVALKALVLNEWLLSNSSFF